MRQISTLPPFRLGVEVFILAGELRMLLTLAFDLALRRGSSRSMRAMGDSGGPHG